MRKILAFFALASVVATATAQDITKPGLYNKRGELVQAENQSVIVNVKLHVVTEHFTPGVYASYEQKYLGVRATYSESTSVELVGARLAMGEAEKPAVVVENKPEALPLPVNKMSATAQSVEAQAEETANLIFTLRKARLDLITGEAGENVFGAGLKNALDEIDAIEKQCLEMFFGKKTTTEEIHTFNIAITPDKTEYAVCRFNDKTGVVAADDLSGKLIALKVETAPHKEYADLKQGKFVPDYVSVPQSKCSLIKEGALIDTLEFASFIFAESIKPQVTK